MSPAALTGSVANPNPDHTDSAIHSADQAPTNHGLPTRSPTEESHDQTQTDDAATMAASEELRHTTISDRVNPNAERENTGAGTEIQGQDKDMRGQAKPTTPEHDELKERISSPKKKRGREFEDDIRDVGGNDIDQNGSAIDGGSATQSRTVRSEPEKKRPRDTSEETNKISRHIAEEKEISATAPLEPNKTASRDVEKSDSSSAPKHIFGSGLSDKPHQTSSSAFMSSGFSALASSATSPFSTVGAVKPSVFGGSVQQTTSGFGSLASAKPSDTSSPTTSVLGGAAAKPASGFAFGAGASTSGFGALGSSSVFGSSLGNGFSGSAGPKLSSFAAPGKEVIAPAKPAKAFGAPDSDEDEDNDEGDSEEEQNSDEEDGVKASSEDKKKSKSKVYVEDGESGEATLLQLRAKLFALESKEAGWKERGVGTLKINVPKSCASFDGNGIPIPGSFDISGLEDEDGEDSNAPSVPRLIMRQENTHRVILNTIIVRAMEFLDKPSTGSAQVLFTAFEGEKEAKPINMLLKMSENNAKNFRSEIDSIQHEL